MLHYLKHHFRLAMPLVAFAAASVFLFAAGIVVAEVALGPQAVDFPLVRTLGDGVDEFSVLLNAAAGAIVSGAVQASVLIAAVALIATAVVAVSSLHRVLRWVDGPSDAGALLRHVAYRVRRAAGISAAPIAWGIVRDAETGRPLPLARVHLLDAHGSVVASAIADAAGRYGFHAPVRQVIAPRSIGGLAAAKDGYFLPHHVFATATGTSVAQLDLPMERATAGVQSPSHSLSTARGRFAESVAFWSGMVAVPAAYIASPSRQGALLIGLFALAAIVRAVGSVRHQQSF